MLLLALVENFDGIFFPAVINRCSCDELKSAKRLMFVSFLLLNLIDFSLLLNEINVIRQ